MTALAIVVAVAVLREGSEVVLFLYGIAASGSAGFKDLLIGGLFGLALGCALSLLMFYGLVAIPARYLFAVTDDADHLSRRRHGGAMRLLSRTSRHRPRARPSCIPMFGSRMYLGNTSELT